MKLLFRKIVLFCAIIVLPVAVFPQAKNPAVFVEMGHAAYISALCMDPQGRYIFSGSYDGTVKIWDYNSRFLIRTLAVPGGGYVSIAPAPNGKQFAFSSNNGITVYDFEKGEISLFIESKNGRFYGIAYTPDGSRIVCGAEDKTVKILDSKNGRLRQTLSGHENMVFCVAVSPNGSRIVSASEDSVRIWNMDGILEKTFINDNELASVLSVAFTPDSTFVIFNFYEVGIATWDILKEAAEPDFTGIRAGVFPLGDYLVVVSSGDIVFWDSKKGPQFDDFPDDFWYDKIYSQTITGETVIIVTNDNALRIWEKKDGDIWASRALAGNSSLIKRASFISNDQLLVTTIDDTEWRWDFKDLQKIENSEKEASGLLALSSDGKKSVVFDSDIIFHNGEEDTYIKLKQGYANIDFFAAIYFINPQFSPDGKFLASATLDWNVRIWNTQTGREQGILIGHRNQVNAVVYSKDGQRLITASNDKTIKVWDAKTFFELKSISTGTAVLQSLALTSDGKYLYCGFSNGIFVLDTATWKETKRFAATNSGVLNLTFSPDGRLFVFTGNDRTLRVWKTDGAECAMIAELKDPLDEEKKSWVIVTPQGFYKASSGGEQYMRVRDGGNVYGIEKYRAEFMRPEKITETLGASK